MTKEITLEGGKTVTIKGISIGTNRVSLQLNIRLKELNIERILEIDLVAYQGWKAENPEGTAKQYVRYRLLQLYNFYAELKALKDAFEEA